MRRYSAIVAVAVLLLSLGCAQDTGDDDTGAEPTAAAEPKEGPAITVGSANFTESIILAEIYAGALEAEGYEVDKKLNIGAREVYFPALEKGDVDLLPEYTGSLLSFLTKQKVTASPESEKTYDDLTKELEDTEVTVLEMSDAQDKDGIVTNMETAEEHGLEKVSDLKPVASGLVMGGPPECPEREACLKGLEEVYGIEFKEFKPLDTGGPQTIQLLKANEIQVANLFTTDGRIAANDFVLLEDDKGIVGAENVVPAIREEIVEAHGDELVDLLNSVTAKLTTDGLTALNKRADVDKDDPDDVAGSWLRDNDFI